MDINCLLRCLTNPKGFGKAGAFLRGAHSHSCDIADLGTGGEMSAGIDGCADGKCTGSIVGSVQK